MSLDVKLAELSADLKGMVEKAKAQQDLFGGLSAELKASIEGVIRRMDDIEVKLAAPRQGENYQQSFERELKENDSLQRLIKEGRGSASIKVKGGLDQIERKTTITSAAVGNATSGVLMFDRTPGIVPDARRRLQIIDLLTSIPTSMNAVDYVKVSNFAKVVSPQTEAAAKAESEITFTTVNTPVRTIATTIPATRQVLDDFQGLQGFLQSSLTYALREEIEDQVLTGNNTGQNLNGLVTQATSFSTGLLGSAYNRYDVIGRAIQQIQSANEIEPDFVVLNPVEAWDLKLTKDKNNNYIGNVGPNQQGPDPLWGLRPIVTNAMTAGQFLVGTSAPVGSVVRDRMEVEFTISTEHSDFFTKNMVMMRAEARLALVVFRPASYIYGALAQSIS